MAKIIVERPRWGHGLRTQRGGRSRALVDDDGNPLPARELTRYPRREKSLNENLNPLKRYLASQVGRPWDKVYSEISAHLRPTSTVQQHVRDHLDDFVARDCRMKDGVVVALSRRAFGGELPISEDWRLFYVHPRTGLLRRNVKRMTYPQARKARLEAEKRERAKRAVDIDAKTQLHLFDDGAWWEVKLALFSPSTPVVEPDVVLRTGLTQLSAGELYGRGDLRAIAKRQLSKAEMKQRGLR
ncbi:MAG: hypothetical protein ABUS57_05035 [Pseudomonadota bacterium]